MNWHFLNYGAFSANLPSTMTDSVGHATLVPAWTGSKTYVGNISGFSSSSITVFPTPALPLAGATDEREISAGWYYSDDDSTNINAAIGQIASSGGPQLVVPGNCGTTVQINGVDANGNGPALVGTGIATSGLYALGAITGSVYNRSDINAQSSTGGGLRNMAIDAMGLVSFGYTQPSGGTTGGTVVEVDGGKTGVYADLEIRNATGGGNAVFQCGSDTDSNANAGGNWYRNLHAFTDQTLFSGAQFPDADIRPAGGCHDSFFGKVIAANATVANILHVNGGALH
ncbi:MAG TPA: hypothetical protein VGL35_13025, partial [Rhizomicrobium sp.]